MHGKRFLKPGVILALLFTLALGSGCAVETRHKILAAVFEHVPPAGQQNAEPAPYVGHPRRQPPYKPPPAAVVRLKAYKPAFKFDWRGILLKLPKDAAGGVDWVAALEDDKIEPKAGLDPSSQDLYPVMPLDVQLDPKGLPMFDATFPHKPHTEWLACDSCHPKIFKMKAGADPITMAKIFAGEYCGRCHGKVAFEPTTGCARCHLALAGPQ